MYLIISVDVVVWTPELQPSICPGALSEAPGTIIRVGEGVGAPAVPGRLGQHPRETAKVGVNYSFSVK